MSNNRLIIKNIQLFLTSEKKAKRVDFSEGINIVTSNQENGNKVGKSLILKSIYHALGADSYFDKSLFSEKMVFIVQFVVNDIEYSMLRSGKLFKLFDSKNSLILATDSASKLAQYLYEIYNFYVYLPSRDESKLVIAPPAYAYILNYIDQDHMNGSTFASFDRLTQFNNYKESLLYCHFGLFNESYFDLVIKKNKLSEQLKTKNNELEIIRGMLDKIQNDIPKAVPEDIESLRIDLNRRESEYSEVYAELKRIKDKLIRLRNSQTEISAYLEEIKSQKKSENKDLEKIITEHNCPLCRQEIHDDLEIRVIKNINIEDLSQTSLELQQLFVKREKDISKEEKNYSQYLQKLNEYKKILRGSRKNQEEIIRVQGYSDLKTKLEQEWSEEHNIVMSLKDKIKLVDDKLGVYTKKKAKLNSSYFNSMKQDKLKFGLEEVTDKSIQNVKNVVRASGSNNPVVTIVWYFNLLKLKNKFNPEAIKFPIILDSPNHGELDDQKKAKLFDYLFTNISDNSQCIISTLGFDSTNYEKNDLDLNIIQLNNAPYNLLTSEDYEENVNFLEILIEKDNS
ncbi:hypothetical protein [Enterococcus faecalis]|uniref:hypothetical protein n=1 Tax=Enterococcus faecalis TaxID=1351 RepID=UPI001925F942|nr:hypothetical protein [Enterococcus faecalis]EGO8088252.1 hypothetical protein [Enterococcus faecalis]EGO8233555.1 hypothetical protein [Enterococcus faecalis]EGO8502684.1 hypothetical protein [Enterococcus faecalis]MCD5080880.1 hypothetical protein [Enterococcus faecalis]MCU7779197.1 hypothetical protein [Enterococcus faecalis]